MDIGLAEIIMLAVLALLIFGPERLPGVARSVGRTVGQIRREATSTFDALRSEVELDELRDVRGELRRERQQLARLTDLSDVEGSGQRAQSAPPPRFDPQAT
jgi:sec-independent protein translocase protein TatB